MLLVLLTLCAADWPCWRGPTGQGVSDAKGLPVAWAVKDCRWTHDLDFGLKSKPDQNQSSPIIADGKVIVCHSAWADGVSNKEFPTHFVRAIDRQTGKTVWEAKVAPGPWSRASDLRGGYTAPTPAAADGRVFVCFGSSVLAALDLNKGSELWRVEIRPTDYDVAMASSPVVVGDLVVLQLDGVANSSRLTAFDAKTGAMRWNEKRPKMSFSHSTPTLVTVAGKPRLLVAASSQLQAVDPASGKVLWQSPAAGDTSSPVWADGLAYVDSGRGSKGVCVDDDGKPRWTLDRVSGGFGSPVVRDGLLYRLTDPGILHVYDWMTGEEVSSLRIPGISTAVSPVVTADGRLYLASAGKSAVLKLGRRPEVIGTGDLGDPHNSSPAVSGGKLILRGKKRLYCLGAKEG
jgi:outer membrane protein assembly factor BamB